MITSYDIAGDKNAEGFLNRSLLKVLPSVLAPKGQAQKSLLAWLQVVGKIPFGC